MAGRTEEQWLPWGWIAGVVIVILPQILGGCIDNPVLNFWQDIDGDGCLDNGSDAGELTAHDVAGEFWIGEDGRCQPGAQWCLDETTLVTCGPDGTLADMPSCPSGSVCLYGKCLLQTCTPQEVDEQCLSPTSYSECNEWGTAWLTVQCEAPHLCFQGACKNLACEPGEIACKGDKSVHECIADGNGDFDWYVIEECGGPLSCQAGMCLTKCQVLHDSEDEVGCGFWAVDLDNAEASEFRPVGITVSLSPGQLVPALLSIVFTGTGEELAPHELDVSDMLVYANQLKTFRLPPEHSLNGSIGVRRAFHISSTQPVSVWQHNPMHDGTAFSNDSSLLLPERRLGTEHYGLSWLTRVDELIFRSTLTVIAVRAGITRVEVWPTGPVEGGVNVPPLSADPSQPYVFFLARGDVLNLEADDVAGADLTGTRVLSDRPIAVFGGHECANIPSSDVSFCDHLEQQLPPVSQWGKKHLCGPFLQRSPSQMDTWRIVAARDATSVELWPQVVAPTVLNSGEFLEVTTKQAFELSASGPVLVGQYMHGSNHDGFLPVCPTGTGIGDPSLLVVTPLGQHRAWFRVSMPPGYAQGFLNFLYEAGTEEQISINGQPFQAFLPGVLTSLIGESSWVMAQVPVQSALLTVDAGDSSAALYAYGYGCDVSYAMQAGSGTRFIRPEDKAVHPGCVDYYQDADGDGYGNLGVSACMAQPEGELSASIFGDCNDADPNVNPSADEVCDDKDNDCDGQPDDGCDQDGDGWCAETATVLGLPAVCPHGAGDCDDFQASAHPYATEIPGDLLDNDCNGVVDDSVGCPGPCTGQTVDACLCALELCQPEYLVKSEFASPTGDNIDSAWAAVAHFGAPNNDLAPVAGESYLLLASGPAMGTSHTTDMSGGGSVLDPFSNDGFSTHDNVEFRLTLKAPEGALGFSLDYIFFSEEYEEWIGASFNDKFYMVLKAPQTTSGQQVVINHTACSNPSSYWDFEDEEGEKRCYIAVNTAYSEPCSNPATDISGTGFECGAGDAQHGSSTGWLQTSWPIHGGETFELVFHIHDTSDGIYDSEAILDNFRWLTGPFQQGTASHKEL